MCDGENRCLQNLALASARPSSAPEPREQRSAVSSRLSPLPPVVTDERLNKLWPQPKSIRQLSGEPVPYPDVLPLTVSPGGESVHRIMDVFELHKNKFRSVQRRICLNEAGPISDCISNSSSECKIHCCGKLFNTAAESIEVKFKTLSPSFNFPIKWQN